MINKEDIFINLPMDNYSFIPAHESKDYKGFFTEKVCECVLVYIKSEVGDALAHFYHNNDSSDLIEKILCDFKSSKNLNIMLIGGNFNNFFLPWKLNKRNLKCLNRDRVEVNVNYSRKKSLQKLEKRFIKKYKQDDSFCEMEISRLQENKLLKGLTKSNLFNGLYTLDLNKLNFNLKEEKPVAKCTYSYTHFPIENIKDFMGYQTLSRIIQDLEKLTTLNLENLTLMHRYCDNSSNVWFYFSDSFDLKNIFAEKRTGTNLIELDNYYVIKKLTHYWPLTSINKSIFFWEGLQTKKSISNYISNSFFPPPSSNQEKKNIEIKNHKINYIGPASGLIKI